MKKYCFAYLVIIGAFLSCGNIRRQSLTQQEKAALDFAEAYFNYDFREAAKHVTAGSGKWLEFAASNMTEEDIELLGSMDEAARVEVDSSQTGDEDVVFVSVCNFMQKDSIFAKRSRIVEKACFRIPVETRGKESKVRMEGLPRSERRSRD